MALGRAGLLVLAAAIACGGGGGDGGPDGTVTDDPCSADETRCAGPSYQICGSGGTFVESESCSGGSVCDPGLGCVECRPSELRACMGDEVHQCNDDGTLGDLIETCEFESCSNGTCGDDECNAGGVELIYVVDESYRLHSFDPAELEGGGNPFSLIGSLNCPAGSSWPAWGGGNPATPFSMSVDRTGTAWVLYTSGEIFHVSTQDASCQATTFVPGQAGFELFGMGFVSDEPGSRNETLYISGGSANQINVGNLGSIDADTLTATSIGGLPTAEYGPELTGTGDAKLYGYFPQSSLGSPLDPYSYIRNLNKGTVGVEQEWSMDPLPSEVRAWAFAHWGGKFYVFITTGFTVANSRVLLLDPTNGSETVAVANSPNIVVGAGVSTCAPISVD